jgi:HSP20 family protein
MNAVAQKEDSKVSNVSTKRSLITPVVNIFENRDGYVLEAEMPGVQKSGLDVTLEGNELIITGRRNQDAPNAEVLYRESRAADFRRVFELDPAIDVAKISARIDQGLLTLHLPKAEKVAPRKIAVVE